MGNIFPKYFRCLTLENHRATISTYIRVQILTNTFNQIWRNLPMMASISVVIIVEIMTLHSLISSMERLPTPIATLLFVVAINLAGVIHAVFKASSYPFTKSCELIVSLKKCGGRSKFVRKYVAACRPTKIFVSHSNFFDSTTSLHIWQFCLNQLISLLLMYA